MSTQSLSLFCRDSAAAVRPPSPPSSGVACEPGGVLRHGRRHVCQHLAQVDQVHVRVSHGDGVQQAPPQVVDLRQQAGKAPAAPALLLPPHAQPATGPASCDAHPAADGYRATRHGTKVHLHHHVAEVRVALIRLLRRRRPSGGRRCGFRCLCRWMHRTLRSCQTPLRDALLMACWLHTVASDVAPGPRAVFCRRIVKDERMLEADWAAC